MTSGKPLSAVASGGKGLLLYLVLISTHFLFAGRDVTTPVQIVELRSGHIALAGDASVAMTDGGTGTYASLSTPAG
jgi:hypothetical protein